MGEREKVSVFESYATRPDPFFQTAIFRADSDAATRDSLQRDDSKRLCPTRRYDQNSMSIQKLSQSGTSFFAGERYLSIQTKFSCELSQFFFFRAAANDREIS